VWKRINTRAIVTCLRVKRGALCPAICCFRVRQKKFPVCICLQGHTTGFHISIGEKKYEQDDKYLQTSTFAIDVVKNGYAALAIEQRGMGERTTLRQDRGPALTCGCMFTAMTALMLGRTIIGERVWDVSKAIDSLEYFKDKLDLEDITLLGQSGGGTATYYAACYDQRIRTVVPSCSVCTYKDSIGDMWHCTCNYIPGIVKYFDMGELSALIAPRKLLTVGLLWGNRSDFSFVRDERSVFRH